MLYNIYKRRNQKGYNEFNVTVGTNQENYSTYKQEIVEVLNNFKGNLPVSTGMKEIKILLTDTIPVYLNKTKDLSRDDLKKYYQSNSKLILNELHISSEDSFVNMIEKFRNLDLEINLNTIDRCELSKEIAIKLKIVFNNESSIEVDMLGNNIETFYLEY